jgi:predicted phosphodiesterase
LAFTRDLKKHYKCNTVIFGGDVFDQYTLSTYKKDPDSSSTREEFNQAKETIKGFIKEFPNAICLLGNHDIRIMKRLKEINLPIDVVTTTFNQLWGIPNSWVWKDRVKIDNVMYSHGSKQGIYSHVNTSKDNRCSSVTCHTHSAGGVHYMSSYESSIFAVNAGCLINDRAYAFNYASEMAMRPVLGSAVILNNGTLPIFISM